MDWVLKHACQARFRPQFAAKGLGARANSPSERALGGFVELGAIACLGGGM
jgi:hypothetical protein